MLLNYIRKILVIVGACFLFQGFQQINAKEIVLGGKAGWPDFQQSENVTTGKGRFGYDCIELATNSFVFDDYTDLLLNFENADNPIAEGQYKILMNNMKISTEAVMDKQAGLSRNMGGLQIMGKPGTFFGSEGLMGSFSIEFWICPSVSENGETVLKWETSRTVNGRLVYQILSGIFNNGHLEWTLSNLFDYFGGTYHKTDIVLKGSSNVVPDSWSYHALSYDCESGLLEYYVNGIAEDLKFLTSNGKEGGEVSLVYLGTPSRVEICPEYTGKIDDFRILRRPYSPPDYQSAEVAGKLGTMMYIPSGGRFKSKPMMTSTGAILNSINAEMNIPQQTAVCLFVRSGDNYYNWTDDYPEWKPVESGQTLSGVTGLYFQVAAELYPDGDGMKTPSITQITLDYQELPEPLPPFTVKAVAGNGKVTVSWSYSVDETTGGYYLYYGTRPGEYLGRVALEGDSPVNVGNTSSYTLTGLENGKIYYFAVAAWSAFDDRVIGNLSKEVYARPLSRLK